MLASPDFISIVVKFAEFDLFRNFKTGAHLVRGYADLGHEEFVLIGPGKLVSLYTGTHSALPEEHEGFFSRVPTIEEMTDIILRRNYDVKEVQFKDQRIWSIVAEQVERKELIGAEHREYECALGLLLLAIISKN